MTFNEITPELIGKAKEAKTPAELLKMAEDEGVMLTEMQARQYFDQLNPKMGELEDDELDNVSGGACGKKKTSSQPKDLGYPNGGKVRYSNGCCPPNEKHNFSHQHFYLEWVTMGEGFRLKCTLCGKYLERGNGPYIYNTVTLSLLTRVR